MEGVRIGVVISGVLAKAVIYKEISEGCGSWIRRKNKLGDRAECLRRSGKKLL